MQISDRKEYKIYTRQFIPAIILLVIFIAVSIYVNMNLLVETESLIYKSIIQFQNSGLTVFAKIVSFICNPIPFIILSLLLLIFPLTRSTIAVPTILSAFIASCTNIVLKSIFARERPSILRLVHETSYSFPSGHSTVSAAAATILFFLILFYIKTRGVKIALCLLCILLPILVGISRIYLGVHHAGDILGGWLLGSSSGFFISAFIEFFDVKLNTKGKKEEIL